MVVYGVAYMVKIHNTNRYPDGVIPKDSISFEFENSGYITNLSFLEQTEADNFTLLQQDAIDREVYHIVFSKGKYDLFSGEYLSKWNYREAGNCAIIGEEADGKGKDVLGTISDYDVFARRFARFFLDLSITEVFTGEVFIIASEIEDHAMEVFKTLKNEMGRHGLIVKEIQSIHVLFGDYDANEIKLIAVVGIFWVIMLVLTAISAFFWYTVRKSLYRVFVMFGARVPLLRIFLPFLLIACIAFSLQWIVYIFIHGHSSYTAGVIFRYSVILYGSLILSLVPVTIMAKDSKN